MRWTFVDLQLLVFLHFHRQKISPISIRSFCQKKRFSSVSLNNRSIRVSRTKLKRKLRQIFHFHSKIDGNGSTVDRSIRIRWNFSVQTENKTISIRFFEKNSIVPFFVLIDVWHVRRVNVSIRISFVKKVTKLFHRSTSLKISFFSLVSVWIKENLSRLFFRFQMETELQNLKSFSNDDKQDKLVVYEVKLWEVWSFRFLIFSASWIDIKVFPRELMNHFWSFVVLVQIEFTPIEDPNEKFCAKARAQGDCPCRLWLIIFIVNLSIVTIVVFLILLLLLEIGPVRRCSKINLIESIVFCFIKHLFKVTDNNVSVRNVIRRKI